MEDLDDIRYAVKEIEGGQLVAFFGSEEDAAAFMDAVSDREYNYVVLDRDDDDFHIDFDTTIRSSFDVRG